MVKIVCIGKKHESIYEPAISHFENRLKPYTKLEWRILPHSQLSEMDARKDESARILSATKVGEYVILLDETGVAASSPDIASHIGRAQYSSQDVCIVIGGAYGVDQSVHDRAQFVVSFGKAVFPHQLMRVMILEQLYRAYSILAGGKYHHE